MDVRPSTPYFGESKTHQHYFTILSQKWHLVQDQDEPSILGVIYIYTHVSYTHISDKPTIQPMVSELGLAEHGNRQILSASCIFWHVLGHTQIHNISNRVHQSQHQCL